MARSAGRRGDSRPGRPARDGVAHLGCRSDGKTPVPIAGCQFFCGPLPRIGSSNAGEGALVVGLVLPGDHRGHHADRQFVGVAPGAFAASRARSMRSAMSAAGRSTKLYSSAKVPASLGVRRSPDPPRMMRRFAGRGGPRQLRGVVRALESALSSAEGVVEIGERLLHPGKPFGLIEERDPKDLVLEFHPAGADAECEASPSTSRRSSPPSWRSPLDAET